jgi:hypothetical protein
MDYYFTRAERNSPPRERKKEKRFNTEGTESRHRNHREDVLDTESSTSRGAAVLRPY